MIGNDYGLLGKIDDLSGNLWGETDALCYGFSALIMARAFPKVDTDNFDIAVAAQCTTLACAIDAGALSKQYIYNSYVNLMTVTLERAIELTEKSKHDDLD